MICREREREGEGGRDRERKRDKGMVGERERGIERERERERGKYEIYYINEKSTIRNSRLHAKLIFMYLYSLQLEKMGRFVFGVFL